MPEPAKKPAKKASPATRRRKTQEAVQAAADSVREAREAEREADEAAAAAQRAGEAAVAAAEEVEPDDPLLDTAIRQIEAGASDEQPFGEPGEPLAERSPFRVAFTASLGVLSAVLLAKAVILVRDVIILIVISGFLAIGLNPAVEFLQRRRLKRAQAVAAVVGVVLLFFGGFVAAAVPPVAGQATELQKTVPEYAARARENKTFARLDKQFHIVEKITKSVNENAGAAAGSAVTVARGILTAVFKTVTVLILTLYFLASYPNIKRGAYRLIPRSRRARVGLIADEILARVGGYVLGNLATSFIAGFFAFVFFMIAGVPYPFALAMLVAIFDLIPLVGATIAAVVCTAVAFFVSVEVGIASTVYFLLYQQIENFVVVPKVMKRTVDISPLATIVAALIGGTLLGVIGALLAIPVAAAIQLVGSEVVYPRQDAG
ncbi:MAG TPA: AI-2E family transporter [Frankiaceae bacterium]|jgi:predicted PurR-regulated permease PerM|nr:AI-2E family transporter [Frankiaceae bacterium]